MAPSAHMHTPNSRFLGRNLLLYIEIFIYTINMLIISLPISSLFLFYLFTRKQSSFSDSPFRTICICMTRVLWRFFFFHAERNRAVHTGNKLILTLNNIAM